MKYTLLFLVLLAGCAETEAFKAQAVTTVSTVSHHARQDAELVLCHVISIDEWQRAYGNDPAKADAWRKLCSNEVKATP